MVVNPHALILCGLALGLIQVRAETSARASLNATTPAATAPEIPQDAQALPQALSGKYRIAFSPQSPVMEFEKESLPYSFISLSAADTESVLIESEATKTVVPLEAYLYNEQGECLATLSPSDFEVAHAYFLKPDRLHATLFLDRFPKQKLRLLILPAVSERNRQSKFEHPANVMAEAKSNARVLTGKRSVPHSIYGNIFIHVTTKAENELRAQVDPSPFNERMPNRATNPYAGTDAPAKVSEETKTLYQSRIQAALDAGDSQKVSQLKKEAGILGISASELPAK